MALTLYRRHTRNCTKNQSQNFRVYKSSPRAEQCRCPITAEGTLRVEGFLSNRSTKETAWDKAESIANHWEEWGATIPPAPEAEHGVAIGEAVDAFLTSKGPLNENVETGTLKKMELLLQKRLLPFATRRGLRFIHQFEDLHVVTKFRESWVNLNPDHNRKVEKPSPPKPLSPNSVRAEVERLRQLFRFCIKRRWMHVNPADELKVRVVTEQKEPYTREEMERIFAASSQVPDGRGRVGQQNAKEVLAFIYVLRYAGLRISDATKLEITQLVPRPSDPDRYALSVFQEKVKRHVYVPIPSGEYGHPDVPRALLSLPLRNGRYFFWTGEGALDTATTNWRDRVTKLLNRAGPFRNRPHPHRFRHTFAAEHLLGGMDIRDVSLMLGHRSVTVTEKHYAKFVEATRKKLDFAADESFRRQKEKPKMQIVSGKRLPRAVAGAQGS